MQQAIYNWLNKLKMNESLPNDVIAINFGLFESTNNYNLYMIGSHNFDSKDSSWADEINFEPKDKFLELTNSKKENWQTILNRTKTILTNYINSEMMDSSILKNVKYITIGFDDGDLIRLK